jgi:hypothetical protein
LAGKGRQRRGHQHGRHIFGLHGIDRRRDAHPFEQILQGLPRINILLCAVARAIQPHHQAITDQLIAAHALDFC